MSICIVIMINSIFSEQHDNDKQTTSLDIAKAVKTKANPVEQTATRTTETIDRMESNRTSGLGSSLYSSEKTSNLQGKI